MSHFKITIPNHVFKALVARTGPEEADVVDGGSVAVRGTCSCEGDLVPAMLGPEFEKNGSHLIASRSDPSHNFSIPDDLKLTGGERPTLSGGIVQPKSEDAAEAPLMLFSDGGCQGERDQK